MIYEDNLLHLSSQDEERIEAIFAKGGLLDQQFDHYIVREGQVNMAKNTLAAFINGQLLVTEAGTGTGKTFAYLIPALLLNKKVIISTGSKALQDQIVKNDIPKILKLLNKKINYCVLKGIANYLCIKKYYENKDDLLVSTRVKLRLEKLVQKALAEQNEAKLDAAHGDLNMLASKEIASLFSCTPNQCTAKKCEHYKECFAFRARRRALNSDIVVINHSLFFSHLQVDATEIDNRVLLPKYDALIFDEAHTLCEIGRNFYAKVFSSYQVHDWINTFLTDVQKDLPIIYRVFSEKFQILLNDISQLHNYLKQIMKTASTLPLSAIKYIDYDSQATVKPTVNTEFREKIINVYNDLKAVLDLIKSNAEQNSELFESLTENVLTSMEAIVECMNYDRDKNLNKLDKNAIAYVELYNASFNISVAPIYIGDYFSDQLQKLLESKVGVVMTSATISVNKNFDKFLFDTLGNNLQPQTMIVDSTFDYKNNSMLYVDKNFPAPNEQKREQIIIDNLSKVIDAVNGGIFFLTTSNRALVNAHLHFSKYFSQKRKILVQGDKKSNIQLMQEFKEDGHAILIGTSSFWEGVDVPGRALSLVIIDKLPFTNPDDPFYSAQREKLEQKGLGNAFYQIAIPDAIITLRQGVGRLIRNENDKGALIICDPRIVSSNYGKRFIQALPNMTLCQDLNQLVDFIKSI